MCFKHPLVVLLVSLTMQTHKHLLPMVFLLLPLLVPGYDVIEDSIPCYGTTEEFVSCLTSGGVTNFTTYQTTSFYNQIVELSIQNLRYARPSINKPHAVILPDNKEQVAAAVECSQKGSWTIRLRSGGHSFEGLSSYADTPFVLIDLMNLNTVSVDLESETAWVGAGATLGEVYYAIASSSKRHGFAAGMCPQVGVSGHFSGGGYGALVRKYGLASDNVVDAIMIDARGRFLNRTSMGEDVFWAIRGGGGGAWGAVVAWKIKLLRVPESVTVFRSIRSGSPAEIAELWQQWQLASSSLEEDFFLQAFIMQGQSDIQSGQTGPVVLSMFMGMNLHSTLPTAVSMSRWFPELNMTEEDCEEMSWAEAVIYLRGDFEAVRTIDDLRDRHSFRKTFTKAKSDYVNDPIPTLALEGALELVAGQPKLSMLLDPYGGVMGRMDSDASPFPHRAGILYGIEYYVDWGEKDEEEGKGEEYVKGIRKLYEYLEPYVSKEPRRAYVNNVDLDLGVMDWDGQISGVSGWSGNVEVGRGWGEKYFVGNYDRLVRAKTMIDPGNVFRHPQSIPPL